MSKKKRRKPKGDCLRQCVARVLGLPPSRVPDFVNKHKGWWAYELNQWCRRRGVIMIMGGLRTRKLNSIIGDDVKAWINVGTTRYGGCHAVVVTEGGQDNWDGGIPLRTPMSFIVLIEKGKK